LNIVPRYYPGIRLTPGTYHLRVDKQGYETFDDRHVVIADADRTLDVTLSPEDQGGTWPSPSPA
jgi:hypothetical protein